MKEKILCLIPARGGSKGVKRKNIKLLNGKPLLNWTIDEAKKSKYIDNIVVSTEDKEIADMVKYNNIEVIDRPSILAEDSSSTMDVIFHTLEILEKANYKPKFLLLLQCTSPLRKVKHIDEAIEIFLNNIDRADSLISVTKENNPPWWIRRIDDKEYLKKFIEYDKQKYTRRQDFPQVFRLNGAIYIIKIDQLYKYKDFETNRTIPYVMDSFSSIDIDTEMDFMFAEFILKTEEI